VQDWQQWIEENRPSSDPDYQRLADVTAAIEAEIAKAGPRRALDRRFDYDMVMVYGKRRTDETSQKVKLENPGPDKLLMPLGAAWAEGFAFGALAYTEEGRGRKSEAFLDRIALANINHKLSMADEQTRSEIFGGIIVMNTLGFVSTVRSFKACNVLAQKAPVASHASVNALVASHWMDGFFLGVVFEEMGGHRETA
jgi:hypothetical protein